MNVLVQISVKTMIVINASKCKNNDCN
jgi:hypothetical protein